jgi:hypothetical protein
LPEIILKFGDTPFVYWIVYIFTGIALAKNEITKIPKSFCILIFLIPLEFHLLNRLHLEHSPYIVPSVLLSAAILCSITLQNSKNITNKYKLLIINEIGGGGVQCLFS